MWVSEKEQILIPHIRLVTMGKGMGVETTDISRSPSIEVQSASPPE